MITTKRGLAATAFLLALSLGPALAQPPSEAPPARRLPEIRETGCHYLWEIRKDGGKAFLLGSIHAAPRDFYPLPPAVLAAYDASDAIALEAYSDDQAASLRAQAGMMESGRYREGDSLKAHIPEDLFKRLQAFCKERKYPFRLMQKHRPWAVAFFVENRQMTEMQAVEQGGIENFFAPRAMKAGKPIRSLEDLEAHFKAPFSGGPEEDAALIEQVIGEHSAFSMKEILDWTLAVWRAGDAESLYDFAVAEQVRRYPGLAPYMKRMVSDRNAAMADSVEKFLAGGETVFCIAGMMHCGGQEGVPAILKRRGCAVTQAAKPAPGE